MWLNIIAAVIAALTAYILTPVVRRVAETRGVVAHPGGRRVHARPTPMLGGVAIYIGFAVAFGITTWLAVCVVGGETDLSRVPGLSWMNRLPHVEVSVELWWQILGILLGGALVAIVGVLDDKYELPGWAQAATILLSGLVLYRFGVRISGITSPWHVEFGPWGIPATMIWVLMVTKAVDCMDGLDGLAAGISAIVAATLMMMAAHFAARAMAAVMAAALFGASLGFLRYNYPPAKVFMGTVGAQFLGFMLASISIIGTLKITAVLTMSVPVLVLAVPLLDTAFVVLRRAASGKSIGEADTTHLHHRLVQRGLSHRQVIWYIYGLTILCCLVGYVIFRYVSLGGRS